MKRFLLSGLVMFITLTHLAAQSFVVGEASGINTEYSYPTPFGNNFKSHKSQYLYSAAELTAAGLTAGPISEVAFTVVTLPETPVVCESFSLKITPTEAFSLVTDAWMAAETNVWGPMDYQPTLGKNTFILETPFMWDGISGIVIEICSGSALANTGANAIVELSGPYINTVSHTYGSDVDEDPCSYEGIESLPIEIAETLYKPLIEFTATPVEDCGDFITISETISSDNLVCASELFTLSITPFENENISYSWYTSNNNIDWNLKTTDDTYSIVLNQTESTWYRCAAFCPFTETTLYSIPVLVEMNPGDACICLPGYTSGTIAGDFISYVNYGAINNNSTALPSPFYFNYEEQTTDVFIGNTQTLTITTGERSELNTIAAWLDVNDDGIFSIEEKIGETNNLAAFESVDFDVLIPAGATANNVTLRIREVYNALDIDPCTEYEFGESEDYVVQLINMTVPEVNFNFSGDPTVLFTDNSINNPQTWEWNFGDGFTSTEQNPEHTYTINGTFNVCLTAGNVAGSNTVCSDIIIASYIAANAAFEFSGDPEVTFINNATGSDLNWLWNFGDGITSTEENPIHTFIENGNYNVCLTASNGFSTSEFCQTISITSYNDLTAQFSFIGNPEVTFTDLSEGPINTWNWNFDDGITSSEQNPVHTFITNGVYNVCLTITNDLHTNTFCTEITIDSYLSPMADFIYAGSPLVNFTDISSNTPNSWLWNFGDGFTSTEQNPSHLFLLNGDYEVCLIAENEIGQGSTCQTITINDYNAPIAAFDYSGAPTVVFTNLSGADATYWNWNFGDGILSEEQNPIHTFNTNGVYNVCLTAGNIHGENNICQEITIDNYPAPEVNFFYIGDPEVSFLDATSETPTSWSWDFDDGSFSSEQNPTHTFLENGIYMVCLTASNANGSDMNCKNIVIDSYLAPLAGFTFEGDPIVSFTDISTNEPFAWEWSFGDGILSEEQNPTHTYSENGSYYVCLTATNITGNNVHCENIVIDGNVFAPDAEFTYSDGYEVMFTDMSENVPSEWFWDFGDGFTSTLQNPVHTYATNGTYTVCLTVGNIMGDDVNCHVLIIDDYAAPLINFTFEGDPVVDFTDFSENVINSWLWDFGDGGFGTEQNVSHIYTENGLYEVCLTASGPGGTSIGCKTVEIVTMGSAPITDFSYELSGFSVEFTDLSENTPTDWFWDFGDGGVSGLQNPKYTYSFNGIFNVCLTTTNVFGENSVCKIINLMSSVEDATAQEINVYPNPVINELYFSLDNIYQVDEIIITDVTGKMVNQISATTNSGTQVISVATLQAGIYQINIKADNSYYHATFVKQ
jgi:PKD repeat protein